MRSGTTLKTLLHCPKAVFLWTGYGRDQYRLTADGQLYGLLETRSQAGSTAFLRSYDFLEGRATATEAQYDFACVFGQGLFYGHRLMDLDRPRPLGEYREHFLKLPFTPHGRVTLKTGELYIWTKVFRKNQWVLSERSGGKLLELTSFPEERRGVLKVLRSALLEHPLSPALLLFCLYLVAGPKRPLRSA